jgi:hypothetical protein
MKRVRQVAGLSLGLAMSLLPRAAQAVVVGQVDTFEDGTTNNWVVGLLQMGPHPSPPANVPTGGPAGANDNYLVLNAVGGGGPGSRLSVINFMNQWAGDYLAAGITGISMDLINLGSTDLDLRLLLADPTVGPPANTAISDNPIHLHAGSGWTSVFFPLASTDLLSLGGSVNTALANATELRLYHNGGDTLPPDVVIAQLGVDNIRAVGVPDGGTSAGLFAMALLSLLGVRRSMR